MKTTKLKSPAQAVRVPQTRDEVAEAIAAIGKHTRERLRIEAAMNDEIAEVKRRFEEDAQPHGDAMRALQMGVQTWCEAHRTELTLGGKVKTAAFASGEVRWRNTPPSVTIRALDVVLKTLRQRGLDRFIRTKEEVNKEAILADPTAVTGVAGIKISSGEEFVVVPFEAELEGAA